MRIDLTEQEQVAINEKAKELGIDYSVWWNPCVLMRSAFDMPLYVGEGLTKQYIGIQHKDGSIEIFDREGNLVSPPGMVETPRLQAKRSLW